MRPKIQSSQAPLAGHRAQLFRRLACNFTYGVNAIVLGDDRLERASLVNDATKLVNPSDVQTVYFSVVSCQTLKEWLDQSHVYNSGRLDRQCQDEARVCRFPSAD